MVAPSLQKRATHLIMLSVVFSIPHTAIFTIVVGSSALAWLGLMAIFCLVSWPGSKCSPPRQRNVSHPGELFEGFPFLYYVSKGGLG